MVLRAQRSTPLSLLVAFIAPPLPDRKTIAMPITEYVLHAEIVVPLHRAQRFEALVGEFLDKGAFARLDPEFDAQLLFGLRTPEPFDFAGNETLAGSSVCLRSDSRLSKDKQAHRYTHVFTVPDLQDMDLARIMVRSADDHLYTEINRLTVQEVQNFRTRVRLDRAPNLPRERKQIFYVERQFASKNLGAYIFGIGACFPALEDEGWKNLGIYQAVTGELNTLTELWEMPDNSPAHDVLEVLEQKYPRLFQAFIADYPALAQVGQVLVDTSYATSNRISTPAPTPELAAALKAAS